MAEASVLPPAQYSQPSRKGKKAWRKNVDLTEVQQGLEQVRDDIVAGGVVHELPLEALFTTDFTGSHNIQAEYNRKHKPLKTDQILAQRSAVPALPSHKRASELSNVTNGLVSKKRRMNNVSHKEYERLRRIAYGGDSVHKDVVKADGGASYDAWEEKIVTKPEELDFLDEKPPIKEPVTLKELPISLAADGRPVRAVRKPAAEKSYNPTSKDWIARFDREGAKEVEAERKRLEELETEREKQERIVKAHEEEENEWESEWESEWEGIASGTEEVPEYSTKKRPERKTKAQRNKINKRKAEEALKKREAKEKIKRQQSERIKVIAKQVREQERLKLEKAQAMAVNPVDDSSDDGEDIELKRIQPFGKAKVPDAPLEVLLLEDLADSLRRLKPEGNLLKDRYRSLLLQGKVESRKAAQPKRKESQFTEKWSYKDWRLK